MRRLALALLASTALVGSASAADIARRSAPVVAPVVAQFNWTGFYVGGHVGYGWSDHDWSVTTSPAAAVASTSYDADGFLGGVQTGLNYQVGQWVFGIEGQFSWTGMEGDSVSGSNLGLAFNYDTQVNWLATVAGRIGVAFDQSLIYVKGGAAFGDFDYTIGIPGLGANWSASDTRTGWMLGAGYEFAFAPNWSAKIEYNYLDFGGDDFRAPITNTALTGISDIDHQIHVVKFGVNYRFGSYGKGPVVSKY